MIKFIHLSRYVQQLFDDADTARKATAIYLQRMKIDECFRDMKNLLGLENLMNKQRRHMEKMVALLLIAYVISLWLGETLRITMRVYCAILDGEEGK